MSKSYYLFSSGGLKFIFEKLGISKVHKNRYKGKFLLLLSNDTFNKSQFIEYEDRDIHPVIDCCVPISVDQYIAYKLKV